MDIKAYILILYIILNAIHPINESKDILDPNALHHITDYILSFNTYHFEWSTQHFTTTTTAKTHSACTKNIPSLCIEYTPNSRGFSIKHNDKSFDFLDDTLWSQINYIHSNEIIVYRNNDIDETIAAIESEYESESETEEEEEHSERRLISLSRAKCRVYLYGNSHFASRKGGTFGRRRYRSDDLRRRGFRGGAVRSIKVRGSRCCTAKLYAHDNFRGKRVKFRYGRYSKLRSRRHQIENLASMKVYCGRRRSRRRRRRRWGERARDGLSGLGRGIGGLLGGIGRLGGHLGRAGLFAIIKMCFF